VVEFTGLTITDCGAPMHAEEEHHLEWQRARAANSHITYLPI